MIRTITLSDAIMSSFGKLDNIYVNSGDLNDAYYNYTFDNIKPIVSDNVFFSEEKPEYEKTDYKHYDIATIKEWKYERWSEPYFAIEKYKTKNKISRLDEYETERILEICRSCGLQDSVIRIFSMICHRIAGEITEDNIYFLDYKFCEPEPDSDTVIYVSFSNGLRATLSCTIELGAIHIIAKARYGIIKLSDIE